MDAEPTPSATRSRTHSWTCEGRTSPIGTCSPPRLHPVVPRALPGCLRGGLEPSYAGQPAFGDLADCDPACRGRHVGAHHLGTSTVAAQSCAAFLVVNPRFSVDRRSGVRYRTRSRRVTASTGSGTTRRDQRRDDQRRAVPKCHRFRGEATGNASACSGPPSDSTRLPSTPLGAFFRVIAFRSCMNDQMADSADGVGRPALTEAGRAAPRRTLGG